MTIQRLQRLKDIVKIKALCERAELNYDTIYTKMNRGTPLSEYESYILDKKLSEAIEGDRNE